MWASTKAGAPCCLHLRARAIFDEQGEFHCVRGACRDVTAEQDRDVALAEARHRERSLIQLFRALRQAGDPKAAMEMGVATAAQATGAAGAMLCPVTDGEAGEAIAQFGSPIAAPQLGAPGDRDPAAVPLAVRGPAPAGAAGRAGRPGRRGPDAVAAGGPARLAGRRSVPAARADRPARRRHRPGGGAGGAVAPQPDRRPHRAAQPARLRGAAQGRGRPRQADPHRRRAGLCRLRQFQADQ